MEQRQALLEAWNTDWYKPENIRRLLTDRRSFPWYLDSGAYINNAKEFNIQNIMEDLDQHPNACDPKKRISLHIFLSLLVLALTIILSYGFFDKEPDLSLILECFLPFALLGYWASWIRPWVLVILYLIAYMVCMTVLASNHYDAQIGCVFFAMYFPILARRWINLLLKPNYNIVTRAFILKIQENIKGSIDRFNDNTEFNGGKKIKIIWSGGINGLARALASYFSDFEYKIVSKSQPTYLPQNALFVYDACCIFTFIIGFPALTLSASNPEGAMFTVTYGLILYVFGLFLYYFKNRKVATNPSSKGRMFIFLILCIPAGALLTFALYLAFAICMFLLMLVSGIRDWQAERGRRQWAIDRFNSSKDPLKWFL